MKNLFSLLICICSIVCMGATQSFAASHDLGVHTPGPSYPPAALKAKVTGSGKCEVEFDASGHVAHVAMTPSTGSKVLDDNTLSFALRNWTGKPKTKVIVPVVYELAPPAPRKKFIVRVTALKPPYPYEARAAGLQGEGMLKVSFDEKGKLVGATMVKSTGSSVLDENTIKYVKEDWYSSGGRQTTMLVPIIYRLVR